MLVAKPSVPGGTLCFGKVLLRGVGLSWLMLGTLVRSTETTGFSRYVFMEPPQDLTAGEIIDKLLATNDKTRRLLEAHRQRLAVPPEAPGQNEVFQASRTPGPRAVGPAISQRKASSRAQDRSAGVS